MPPFEYGNRTLQAGTRSRMVRGVNGLDVHILEAGYENSGRPLALLLHGFPDLAFGWRKVMPKLAEAGYHVVAPDQRGFGRTTGWDSDYHSPLAPFGLLNMVRDAIGIVSALGYRHTNLLVGHDLGSPIAAYCALARPDLFPSLVLISAPFPGPPAFPFDSADGEVPPTQGSSESKTLAKALSELDPPRLHYQEYLATREADADLSHPPEGLHNFLRSFFYVKSGDWPGNKPHPLKSRAAEDLAQMPTYYVMELGKTLPQNVASHAPTAEVVSACSWLTEPELAVYVEEYGRNGFQGALQAYRVYSDPSLGAELRLFSGKTIDVPSLFIGGTRDWGTYSAPGALDVMQKKAMTRMLGVELIDGAGHWVQQEKPLELTKLLISFGQKINNSPIACV